MVKRKENVQTSRLNLLTARLRTFLEFDFFNANQVSDIERFKE